MEIRELIQQGTEIAGYSDFRKAKAEFLRWREAVKSEAVNCQISEKNQQLLSVNLHFVENEYSQADSMAALRRAVEDTKYVLERIEYTDRADFSESMALLIIEKILTNFYLHIKTMYQYQVNTLFMLVYDKESIIKNAAAFEQSFRRVPENGGKTIQAIVIQPVNL